MSVDGRQGAAVGGIRGRGAVGGALALACLALMVAIATAVLTYALAESYGFGRWWDWPGFVMTGGAAVLSAAALLGASRLAKLPWRLPLVFATSVVLIYAVGYVAGVLGDARHH